jgi:hypothetical protein
MTFVGFAGLPLLSLLANLVVLPIISSRFGAGGWTSLALGQALGAGVSVVCSLHWPIDGPTAVARADPEGRRQIYAASLRSRSTALLAAAPFVVLSLLAIRPADDLVFLLAAFATSLNALSANWYFTGTGQPGRLASLEGSVRLLANAVSIPVVLTFPELWPYPVLLGAAAIFSLLLTIRSIRPFDGQRVAQGGQVLDHAFLGTVARSADAAYFYLMSPLVAIIHPAGIVAFTAADRLLKVAFNALGGAPLGFVSWIAAPNSQAQKNLRARRAFIFLIAAAVAVGLCSFPALGVLDGALFAGTVNLSPEMRAAASAALAFGFITRAMYVVLLPGLGRARASYRIMLSSAAAGALALALAASSGPVTAMTAVACTSGLVMGIQTWLTLRSSAEAATQPAG